MRLLSIAWVIAMVLPRIAAAEGTGVIATGGERAAVSRAIADAISGQGRVVADAVDEARSTLASGAVPVETLQRFRRVREQIDEGWRAYSRVQFEFAQARLASARTDAEPLVALPGGAELYADASLRLGAVLGKLGREGEAEAATALALALDPERPITPIDFAPDVTARVDAVRAMVPVRQRVRVTANEPGAMIAIDGREVGRAPLDVEVARGQHVVTAHAPLWAPRAMAVAVADDTREITIDLDRDEEAARLAGAIEPGLTDAGTLAVVESVLRYAELDEILLATVAERRGAPALFVQRCLGGPTRCTSVVEIGYGDRSGLAEAARAAVAEVRGAPLRYTPSLFADARVTGKPITHHRCELCRSPWLWGGIGAAAVIGTIATIAIVTAGKPAPVVGADPGDFMKRP